MYYEINKLINGSIEGKEKDREELLIRLKPMIIASIKRYYNRFDQYDDLIQEGYEIILKALMDFDVERGVEFLGYVKARLRYHYLDKHKEKDDPISLNQVTSIGDDSTELLNLLPDNLPTQEEIIIEKEERLNLWTSLHNLTERQREVVLLFYEEGMDIGTIAKKLEVSYRTIVNIKVSALAKLRKKLDDRKF